jgi:Ni/Co efflux regulator RcnB
MKKLLLAALLAAFAGSVMVAAPVAFAADDVQLAQAKKDEKKKDKGKAKEKMKKKDEKKK